MDIRYEKMTKDDYQSIKNLISEAWFKDYKFSKFIINIYANYYLYYYLSKSNYMLTAKSKDELAGFIFGRGGKISLLKYLYYNIKIFGLFIICLFSKPGRRGIKLTLKTYSINHQLKKPFKHLNGCLELFIVNPLYQRYGIGTTLQNKFCDFLTKKNIKNIYLFTDTYSNYQYYEHRGYIRKKELNVDFKIKGENEKSVYFIYIKELGETNGNN